MTASRSLAPIVAGIIVLCLAIQAVAAATVVVTTLHDASPDSDTDTGQGVADLVAGLLAERVTVVSREKLDGVLEEQGLSAKGLTDARTAVKIGKLLNADFVLSGSIFRRDNRIEFAVQLFDVASGAVVKSISADGAADELFDVASVLAARCAEALKIAGPMVAGKVVGVTHLVQEQNFLKALGCYHAGDYDRAIMHCLKVIELDPNDIRARLRLAESFLASGDAEQAKITFFRTLQLFPATATSPRIESLLDRLEPTAVQAVEKQACVIPLPEGWPPDAQVSYELTWKGQPARRDMKKAERGTLTLEMPGARVPLDLRLVISANGREPAVRQFRLWPADPKIRAPDKKLVVVDPAEQIVGLLTGIDHKRYSSCKSLPQTDRRLIIAPAAAAKITESQARALNKFLAEGGNVVLIGQCAKEIELAGIKSAEAYWPVAKNWNAKPQVAAWSFMPAEDLIGVFSHLPKAVLLRGGAPWLSVTEDGSAIVSQASYGKGRLLWVAWPSTWDSHDPRWARVVALAISDASKIEPASP